MKIIRTKRFPFGHYYAINLFGIIFSKGKLDERSRNHEYIHTLQQRELLFVVFFLLYGLEWLVRLVQFRNLNKAYFNISFEREAYANEHNLEYPKQRPFWGWVRYLVKR